MVVVVSPQGQLAAGVGEDAEDFLVQAFVAQAAMNGLDVAVLRRLARVYVVPFCITAMGLPGAGQPHPIPLWRSGNCSSPSRSPEY